MKYIKFTFRDKKTITLPFDQAERVINSAQQQVKILDENANWTGVLINKADIMKTEVDWERTRDDRIRLGQVHEETVMSPEQQKAYDKRWEKMREDVEGLGILKKKI